MMSNVCSECVLLIISRLTMNNSSPNGVKKNAGWALSALNGFM